MSSNELITEENRNSEINQGKNTPGTLNKVSGSSQSSNLVKNQNMNLNQNYLNIPEEILVEKSKKWRQFNTKRFAEKRKFGFIEGQKESLPCEVLRYYNPFFNLLKYLVIFLKMNLK